MIPRRAGPNTHHRSAVALAGAVPVYHRELSSFESSSKKYDWMKRIIVVGTGDRFPHGPVDGIFEVL
jgi:hypothetical protein